VKFLLDHAVPAEIARLSVPGTTPDLTLALESLRMQRRPRTKVRSSKTQLALVPTLALATL